MVSSDEIIVCNCVLLYLALSMSKARLMSASVTLPFQKSSMYSTGTVLYGSTLSMYSGLFAHDLRAGASVRQRKYLTSMSFLSIAPHIAVQIWVLPLPGQPD